MTKTSTRLLLVQALLIVAAGLWVFYPAFHGDWLWDDDFLIRRNALIRDPAGLWDVWFRPSELVDYFPLTVSFEWIEWRLWGDHTLGYHIVRVALHLGAALLVWRLLAKFDLRLAWLGGLLFAVHPVVVESVAWIAELKNTLSLPPFLLAMCAWMDWERDRKRSDYFQALGFFLVAALCKSTVIMFPVIVLLYAWRRRNRLGWSDLKNAAPLFALSLLIGIATVDFAHAPIGEKPLDLASRIDLAGLDLAFYFSKCVLPIDVLPIYPRWTVDPSSPAQWLPWPILIAALTVCWLRRATWGRHALLGLGFFLINLAPFIGLSQGAYMGFTWVMDHMLYLPLIGLIGLFVAGVERLDGLLPQSARPLMIGAVTMMIVLLAWGSHVYAAMYGDSLQLWIYTFQRNPQSWIVRTNLGEGLAQHGRLDEAFVQFKAAERLDPNQGDVHADLGKAYNQMGRLPEAISEYETVAKLKPGDANAPYNLGNILVRLHRIPEAAAQYEKALQIDPRHAAARYAMGCILLASNQIPEAIDQLRQSLQIDSAAPAVHVALGTAFLRTNRAGDAVGQFGLAAQLDPNNAAIRCDLGVALVQAGDLSAAAEQCQAALQMDPNNAEAHYFLGSIYLATGKIPGAIEQYQAALRLQPNLAVAQKNLAQAQAMEKAHGTKTGSP